jgi:TPP-dependent pyruvate/acetoin dehydrogenase alpha subunit
MNPGDTGLETRLRLYRMAYLIRRTEETLMAEYHPADEMRCPIHFCVGQEAMPAALALLLRRADVLMSHYRSHGYYLAKGAALEAMVAEFYGKATGSNRGVAGSMELGSHDQNFYSGAIVGGSLVMPLGAAFAQRYRGVDDISVAVIGDGAFDEGTTYEMLNLAALHHLPLLVVCENNRYAAHTPIERRLTTPLLDRVAAFGLDTESHDGNDAELLLRVTGRLIADIRGGGGPRFLEVETYRLCGHVGPGDDAALGYRSREEIERWRKRDPVSALRGLIAGSLEATDLERLEAEIDARIHAAVTAAKRAEFANFSEIVATNWSGEYGAAVRRFVHDPTPTFQGGQPEARLGPF